MLEKGKTYAYYVLDSREPVPSIRNAIQLYERRHGKRPERVFLQRNNLRMVGLRLVDGTPVITVKDRIGPYIAIPAP